MDRPRCLLSLLAMALLTGCGRRESLVEEEVRTQTLHVNMTAEPRDFDPQTTTLPADGRVIRALLEGLTEGDPVDCRPVPGVAERWETSADGLTWTFHLRGTARWSNGEAVTAHDFVYAYQRILSPALAAEYREQFFCLRNAAEFAAGRIGDFTAVGVRAENDRTLVLTLTHPVPYLPTLVAQHGWFPVHRATVEKFGRIDQRATNWTRVGNFVGNGAFVLKEWTQSRRVRVTRSETYWDRERVRLRAAVCPAARGRGVDAGGGSHCAPVSLAKPRAASPGGEGLARKPARSATAEVCVAGEIDGSRAPSDSRRGSNLEGRSGLAGSAGVPPATT